MVRSEEVRVARLFSAGPVQMRQRRAPVQMWQGRARSQRRFGSGEPRSRCRCVPG